MDRRLSNEEFKRQLLCTPKPQEALFKREEVEKIMNNNIRFDEEYKRGVHETWGGRAIVVYDILYRLIEENELVR